MSIASTIISEFEKKLEESLSREGQLEAENKKLKKRIDGYKRHAKYLKQVISRNL